MPLLPPVTMAILPSGPSFISFFLRESWRGPQAACEPAPIHRLRAEARQMKRFIMWK
jgi:hypothetical protein